MKRIIALLFALLLFSGSAVAAERRIDGDPVVIVSGNLISAVDVLPAWDAAHEGSICYDRDTDKFYYGDDTQWVEVGGAAVLTTYKIVDADADTTAYVDDAGGSDADQFVVELAGAQRLLMSGTSITFGTAPAASFTAAGIVWNTSAADSNFTVYGDTDTQLFWVDAGLDRVGISTSAPAFTLDVDGTFSANSINVNSAYTLPTTDGTATYVLTTDGAGTVTWAAAPGAGGSDNDWDRNGTDLEPTNDGDDVVLTAGETLGISGAVASNEVAFFSVTADADSRFSITADGTLGWADGTNPVDLTMYRGAAGEAAITGNLSLGAHHLALGKIATPGAAASDTGLIYFDTTTERPYVMDDAGAAACLAIQNVVTLPGQYLAHLAWGYADVQNQPAPVTAQNLSAYDWTNHKQGTGHGLWGWTASRGQRIPDYGQSKMYTAGQMDYNGCDTIKLRAKVWVENVLVAGSAPSGGSYWDSVKFHISENDGSHYTLSSDLQSGLADSAWRIIEADFDISAWTVGAEEGLYFGLEFIGVEVDDPDPDPQNMWGYQVAIEWIEAIAWIN